MKRRTFISQTTQAALTVTFVAACKGSTPADPYAGIERPSLIAYMDEAQMLQIGYLYGVESDTLDHTARTPSVEADFESGNTVIVDGWVLSKTEAEECVRFFEAVNTESRSPID